MPAKNPLISCIIPTYNRSANLAFAINSVLSQTYSNIEVLVVDDQSTDGTKEMVNRIAKADGRVKYFYNPNKGGNYARNLGIENASGDFIAFLDDDDTWAVNKLKKQICPFFEKGSELGVVYCSFYRKKNKSKSGRRHPSRFSASLSGDILKKLLKRNFITTSSILVRADVFKNCGGFDPTYKSFQDWELLTRIATKYQFYFIRDVLVNQYESSDSITLNKPARILSRIRHLKQFMELYKKYPRILSHRYSSLGFSLLKTKRYGLAKKFYLLSLKINPLNPGVLFPLIIIAIGNRFWSL